MKFLITALLASLSGLSYASSDCNKMDVDFIMLQGDADMLAIEDDIKADLAKVGITVNTRALARDDYNAAMVAGDFNLAFTETYGAPYDPHSYATSWFSPDEAYYAALKGLKAPNTVDVLEAKVDAVQLLEGEQERQDGWKEILKILHDQATEIPFSGKSIPAIVNNRLTGYKPGYQQYDYPLHTLRVADGSDSDITVSPGASTGLFKTVGRLDPHSYRPNEFFANNLVYEGLLEFGDDGSLNPSLAESWTVEDIAGGKQKYTFNLRQGVKFHDGEDWKCSVAKLNYDHVFAPPMAAWHSGWWGLPDKLESWECASDYVFEMTIKDTYYPFLQELTYIRPARMLSPAAFVGGATSDPYTQNSCPTDYTADGPITLDGFADVNCAGVTSLSGTGRWKYLSKDQDNTDPDNIIDTRVEFEYFADHWDAYTGADAINKLSLVHYATTDEVKAALEDGSLDAVIGAGVLDPVDVNTYKQTKQNTHTVKVSDVVQNRIVVFNTDKAPTNDLHNRKVMIHAVDKGAIIDKELYGLAEPVDALFPKSAPYCHVDLTPHWDYDFEKADLMNCPVKSDDGGIPTGAIVVIAVCGVMAVGLIGLIAYMRSREQAGQPLFTPLTQSNPDPIHKI